MLFICLTGLAKLTDIGAFAVTLEGWRIVPVEAVWPFALVVPLAEVLVAGAWLLQVERRQSRRIGIVMLLVFTGAYCAELVLHGPAPCGCLGASAIWEDAEWEVATMMLRNSLLLIMLWSGSWLSPSRGAADRPPDAALVRDHRRPAFTLLELLIAIALVGVLVALAMPSLRRVTLRSHDAVKLAALRSHGAVFTAYAVDWRDSYPYMTHPLATTTVLRCGRFVVPVEYFWSYNKWNLALAPEYYDEACDSRSFFAPRGPRYRVFTDYWYSATFLADPAYWNPRTRIGPQQWRAVRTDEVLFPAHKGLHIAARPSPWGHTAVGLTDQSARTVKPGEIAPGYDRGEGPWQGARFRWAVPVMHTIDGVRGRDVR